jgi:hypothetical protein
MSDEKLCNKCGKSCSIDMFNKTYDYGLIDARVFGSYHSPVLDDCTSYQFSLCESCLVDLFDSFIIPPTVYDVTAFDSLPLF